MKQGLPWSIKGIDPDARDVAKAAAKRDGVTLGAWMTQMIFDMGREGGPSGAQSAASAEAGTHTASEPDASQIDMETLVRVVGVLIQKVEQAESSGADRSEELKTLMQGLSDEIGGLEMPNADAAEAGPNAPLYGSALSSAVPDGVEELEAAPNVAPDLEDAEAEIVPFELDDVEPEAVVSPAPADEIPAVSDDEAEQVLSLGAAEEVAAREFEGAADISPVAMDRVIEPEKNGKAGRIGIVLLVGALVIGGFGIRILFPDLAASVAEFFDNLF